MNSRPWSITKREVHFLFHLAENVPHDGIQKELADFILNRRDGFAFENRSS